MNESEVELSVGETVQIGDYSVTVLDIDGDEIRFRLDSPSDDSEGSLVRDVRRWIRPR